LRDEEEEDLSLIGKNVYISGDLSKLSLLIKLFLEFP
jgi:hypothetical protein